MQNSFFFLRRIKWRRSVRRDIVIFDCVGAEILKEAVLAGLDYCVVYSRNEEFPLNLRILLLWIWFITLNTAKSIRSGKFSWRRPRFFVQCSYFQAVLRDIGPKAVITFIDNSSMFQWLSRHYAGADFIAVQNALRGKDNVHDSIKDYLEGYGRKISMPVLYCFGAFEKELYERYGHAVDKFIPVGSLKASFFYEQHCMKNIPELYDLCLISQWRRTIMLGSELPQLKRDIEVLTSRIALFLEKRSVSLVVALCSDAPEEKEFFSEALGSALSKTVFSPRLSWLSAASYIAAVQSRVTISCHSTLCLEVMGLGKKVLFHDIADLGNIYEGPAPSLCFTNDESYENFEKKVLRLLEMDQREYLAITQPWRNHRMNYTSEKPAHRVIREHVEACLR